VGRGISERPGLSHGGQREDHGPRGTTQRFLGPMYRYISPLASSQRKNNAQITSGSKRSSRGPEALTSPARRTRETRRESQVTAASDASICFRKAAP
jgi:hypothetical protein